MTGAPCGLDLNEAMAGVPSALDPELTKNLFIAAERHYVAAALEQAKAETRPE